MNSAAWIDGKPASCVPLSDRGLSYGDGVFRTLLLWQGAVVWRQAQIRRLCADARLIGLTPPEPRVLAADLDQAASGGGCGVIKIMLTAGDSHRGYLRPAQACRRIVQRSALGAWPAAHWSVGIHACSLDFRLSRQPALGGAKHLNRLEQVLARSQLPSGCDEGLLSDSDGILVGGTMSNLFWYADGSWRTPPIDGAGVAGLSRERILALAERLQIPLRIEARATEEIRLHCERLFVCNALIGIWPVARWDSRAFSGRTDERLGLDALRRGLGHPLVRDRSDKTL